MFSVISSALATVIVAIIALVGYGVSLLAFLRGITAVGSKTCHPQSQRNLSVGACPDGSQPASDIAYDVASCFGHRLCHLHVSVLRIAGTTHISDVVTYESGADFSGDLPAITRHLSVQQETKLYGNIAGVRSATVGFTESGLSSGTSPSIPIEIRAVDAHTFARTGIWTPQDSSLSATAVPTLAFASVSAGGVLSSLSSDEFYVFERIIPAHVVIPLSLGLAFVALVAICVIALWIMASVSLRPSVSQTLHLNED